jgi:hypothetical protein
MLQWCISSLAVAAPSVHRQRRDQDESMTNKGIIALMIFSFLN